MGRAVAADADRASGSRITRPTSCPIASRCSIATSDALFKFIATPQYGKEELYDLTKDGREAHNLVEDQPALAALLRDKVRGYLTD